ncbi:diguanylate cyclase [Gayadomonas joobiniege]|uniref:diguanylate cyclase n=1 Tax=Gayadomonas joobiniege TaxID=1234606 RepID=UPI0003746642|nr:diguanylate cyclase [Gayadomonas joobiniege]
MQSTLLIFEKDQTKAEALKNLLDSMRGDVQILTFNEQLNPNMVFKTIQVDCLIIAHSCLPDDGFTFISQLKVSGHLVGVIYINEDNDYHLVRNAFKAGVDDYVNYRDLNGPDFNRVVSAILAQKKVEAIQQKSALELAMLRNVVDQMSNLLMVCDTNTSQLISFNLALNRFSRLTTEQLRSSSYVELSEQFDSRTQWIEFVNKVREEGHRKYEAELKNFAGEKVPFEFDTCISSVSGQEYIMFSGMDISRLKEVQNDLVEQARRDPLTQLRNRRGLSEEYTRAYKNSARNQEHICLALFDIDNFKKLNDTYGHDIGDEILIQFADLLRHHVHRPMDIIARAGGEEFFVMISGQNITALKNIINEIIKATGQQLAPHTTVSAGVILVEPWLEKVGFTKAYKMADSKLYEAKNNGKNHARFCNLQDIN